MKLTETQRRFRKQMVEIEKKNQEKGENPYDYYLHRGKNRSFKKTGGSITGAVLVFLVIVAAVWAYNHRDGVVPASAVNPGLMPQAHGERFVPANEAALLQDLDLYNEQTRTIVETVCAYHSDPWDQRDLNGYRQALLKGMSVATEIESGINSLQVIPELSTLVQITKERTLHYRQAFSSYLDYLATWKSSDTEKGNHFLHTANQKNDDYQAEMLRYLEDNGYKHEIRESGQIRYWHSR